jgi:hypothetical protein
MHWLTSQHSGIHGHGVNRCVLFLLENDFTLLRHQMMSYRQNFNWSGKCSSRPFIWGTTRYSSSDLKIWPWGTPFLTPALTLKVISDRPSKLISWVADYVPLSHQVWSWSNKKYLKNKAFISIMTLANLDLWPWPLWFGMMVTNTLILLIMQTMMFLRRKTKKL